MKNEVIDIVTKVIAATTGDGAQPVIELSIPDAPAFGHFSTNIAMRLAKARGMKPLDLARELAEKIAAAAPEGFFEKVEAAAPGFVNMWLSAKTQQAQLAHIAGSKDFGTNHALQGKMVMVEYTDPNPFKLFHIGHFMSNAIGESFARLYEASGAKVLRANYQGDTGIHIAMTIWAMQNVLTELPGDASSPREKVEYLGRAYAEGSKAYRSEEGDADDNAANRSAIEDLNKKIYERTDSAVNNLYDMGRQWSLDYFETLYKLLGTKFDHYFFEGDVQAEGVKLVHERTDVFKESEGAIVFPGEEYGLHTRVFINSKGFPTYEAKELGLNKTKFELYNPDVSVIVTGGEIVDYFTVLMKAMELVVPNVAAKTHHVGHGMLRLPTGKMSSRTGDVVTAEAMIDQAKEVIAPRMRENADVSASEQAQTITAIAIGAIKYSILKQNPGQDIIFDFDTSLSFEGDSGPYLQYTYARLRSVLRKADPAELAAAPDYSVLDGEVEFALMRRVFEFPDVVAMARDRYAPSALATYLHKLAATANNFYETTPIVKDEDAARRMARLALARVAAQVLKSGLQILGIGAPEQI